MDIFARSAFDDYITDDVLLLQPPSMSCGAPTCSAPTFPSCSAPTLPTCSAPTFPEVTVPTLTAPTLPSVSLPTLTAPTMPEMSVPRLALPTWSPTTPASDDDSSATPVRRNSSAADWIETYGNGCGSQLHVYSDNIEVSRSPWKSAFPVARKWFGRKKEPVSLIP